MTNKKSAIDFLHSLKDDAFVLIFTRADADQALSAHCHEPLTDKEWTMLLALLNKSREQHHANLEAHMEDFVVQSLRDATSKG